MEDMQNQMNAILGNPEMMQKIMAMAQSLNESPPTKPENSAPAQETGGFPLGDIDLSMVQQLSGLSGKAGIDNNQRSLLQALSPYLSNQRIHKLEKAMRAAKMANIASGFLGNSGFLRNIGR